MDRTGRLTKLLDAYEAAADAGKPVTPEELCRDCPDMLAEVRRHVRGVKAFAQPKSQPVGPPTASARSAGKPAVAAAEPTTREIVPGYTLVRKLGKGGFGEVWQARGPGDIMVAMKFVPREGRGLEAEQRALEMMREIRHPHIISLVGSWQQPKRLVIAMELAERSVYARFEECRAAGMLGIPSAELLEYMHQAAQGLDHLNQPQHADKHGRTVGVVHRDIKPQNLLLVGGQVKLGDFGLARPVNGEQTSHTGALTFSYAPPEFFNGTTTLQSDQYSLAVTYCLLACGKLPFEGDVSKVIGGHLKGEPDLTGLPPSERSVVARALAKQPQERWPSCVEFVRELRAADIPAAPVQSLRFRPLRFIVGAAVAFSLVGILLAILAQSPRGSSGMPDSEEEFLELPDVNPMPIAGADLEAKQPNENGTPKPPRNGVNPTIPVEHLEPGFRLFSPWKIVSKSGFVKSKMEIRDSASSQLTLVETAPSQQTWLSSDKMTFTNSTVRLQFSLRDEQACGSIFVAGKKMSVHDFRRIAPKPTYPAAFRQPGEWNEFEFKIVNRRATVSLNGVIVETNWMVESKPVHRALSIHALKGTIDYRNIRYSFDK